MSQKKSHNPFRRKRDERLQRIEELEKLMEETGGDVDPETLIPLWFPRRKPGSVLGMFLV